MSKCPLVERQTMSDPYQDHINRNFTVEDMEDAQIEVAIGYMTVEQLRAAVQQDAALDRRRREEIKRLQAVNEQDRTAVAEGLQTIFQAIKGREWLRLGRGSYEWDDDHWKDEFGAALDEIWDALEPLRQIAGNLRDCPATQSAVDAARAHMSV